ncbi:MAG: metallophosphoesterase [Candidatus Lokiarchaeota archaeon]
MLYFLTPISQIIIKQINKIKDVSLFLHLGDLTQFGVLQDYEYALDVFQNFKPLSEAPFLCLIGNHDAENVGYLLFEELIGERYVKFETDHIYLIGVDSTKPDLAGGIIHHDTVDTLEERLRKPDRENKIKIVCFHHQLIPIPNTGKERSAIDDSGNVLKMLINTETDLVLNGHRHISNLYEMNTQQKDMFIFNAGTFSCNKTRYRELFTYAIIDIQDNTLHFKVLPVINSNFKTEINREITYYNLRKINPKEKPYCKFIQIANTLISNSQQEENKEIVDKAFDEINKIPDVDLIVHCGNLTKNSLEEEYKVAKKTLKSLKKPYIIVPGYSDMKPPAWEFWDKYIGNQNPIFENDKIYFQGLNSTTTDSPVGFVGRKRLNQTIDTILKQSHQKIIGTTFFHNAVPTPLSVWRTELSDSGEVLSQFARSQVDLILNSTPSINFNTKIENSIFSNGGNLNKNHFYPSYLEILIFKDGLTVFKEHNLENDKISEIGKYELRILS